MLAQEFEKQRKNLHFSFTEFKPASQRDIWENFSEEERSFWVDRAEKLIGCDWPSILMTDYREFKRSGDRLCYEEPSFLKRSNLCFLVTAECLEYKGRFLDDIINGIFNICEETFWGVSAHRHSGAGELPDILDPNVELFSAETGALLSLTGFLLASELDGVDPCIRARIDYELNRRLVVPFMAHDDFWWQGFLKNGAMNNWNSWISSNLITVFMLCVKDEKLLFDCMEKLTRVVDFYIAGIPSDGGCDEGVTYWCAAAGGLFEFLKQLCDFSGGALNFFSDERIRRLGHYPVTMHIAKNFAVNFSDGGNRLIVPPYIPYMYGKCIGDDSLCALAAELSPYYYDSLHSENLRIMGFRRLLNTLLYKKETDLFSTENLEAEKYSFLDRVEVMTARESGNFDRGLFLAAKGGTNNESHNHNDVGTVTIYSDGLPAVIDVGVGVYTAKTFSSERYSIWTMQSSWHNLPEINGFMEQNGGSFMARNCTSSDSTDTAEFSADIAGAFDSRAGVSSLIRRARLCRSLAKIEIRDSFTFTEDKNTVSENFILSSEPHISENGVTAQLAPGKFISLSFSHNGSVSVSIDKQDVSGDKKLRECWGNAVWRVRVSFECKKDDVFTCTVKAGK